MRKPNHPIQLNANERAELEGIVRTGQQKARIMRRAQTLLWSDAGMTDVAIAQLLEVTPLTCNALENLDRFKG